MPGYRGRPGSGRRTVKTARMTLNGPRAALVLGAEIKIFELMSQHFRHDRGLQSIDLEGQRAAWLPHW